MKRPAAVQAKAKAKAKTTASSTASATLKRPAGQVAATNKSKTEYVLVSAYTLKLGHVGSSNVDDAKGISVYRREHPGDGSFGTLVFHSSCSDFPCPTYMCCNRERTRIYAVSEVPEEGTVSAYAFDARSGELKLMNSILTGGTIACHVSLASSERLLAVANYGGSVALFPLTADGKLLPRSDLQLAESLGVGVNKERQEGPHPHMACFDRENQHLLVPDLGLDRVMSYTLDGNKLHVKSHMSVTPGSGPRHLVFHPTLSVVYVLNELLSTVIPCHYDVKSGELLPTEAFSTVPGAPTGVDGQTFAAAIRISGDGKFLYVSNRGHDSISVFRVLDDGLLDRHPLALCSTGGTADENENGDASTARWPPVECPRDFALCGQDQYLIVGNQDSDSVVVLERDHALGTLKKTGVSVSCAAPACILPLF